jgi:hypothetical protein
MKKYEWRKICLILLLLAVALELGRSETVASESHVPEGLTMQVEFNPGIGEPLGVFKRPSARWCLSIQRELRVTGHRVTCLFI